MFVAARKHQIIFAWRKRRAQVQQERYLEEYKYQFHDYLQFSTAHHHGYLINNTISKACAAL